MGCGGELGVEENVAGWVGLGLGYAVVGVGDGYRRSLGH